MAARSGTGHKPWLHLGLWACLILDLVAAFVLPPWLDDDTRRRIAASGALRVGLDPAYPPFEHVGEQGELIGYDVELARALGQELELQVEFVPMAYDGLYDALVSGQVDLILSSYPYSPELCGRERCTPPYFQAGQVLVVPGGSAIAGPADLADRSVGAELGSAGDALLRTWEQAQRLGTRVTFMGPQEALQALAAGQVDAVVVDRTSALAFAGAAGGLVVLEPAVEDEAFVGVVAQHSVWLHGRLQWALDQLVQRGVLDELETRWCRGVGD